MLTVFATTLALRGRSSFSCRSRIWDSVYRVEGGVVGVVVIEEDSGTREKMRRGVKGRQSYVKAIKERKGIQNREGEG